MLAAFPAALRGESKGAFGDVVVDEGEASCFQHAEKRAKTACERCGRFLCELCDVVLRGHHYCAGCLEQATSSGDIPEFRSAYNRFDLMALAVACLPFMLAVPVFVSLFTVDMTMAIGGGFGVMVFPALVSGPIAIYLSIAYRKRNAGPWPRSKAISILAFAVGASTMGFLVLLIAFPIVTLLMSR